MTRSILILVPLFMGSLETACQRFDIGVAGVYGDDISTLGQNTRLYINSDDHRFCLGPEFSWFLEDSETSGNELHTRNLMEFNLNAHINLELIGKLAFYPLIGANYSIEKEELFLSGEPEEQETIKKWGMNLGSGLHYKLASTWIFYAEYDHLFSELHQNTFSVGILYGFGKIGDGHHPEGH